MTQKGKGADKLSGVTYFCNASALPTEAGSLKFKSSLSYTQDHSQRRKKHYFRVRVTEINQDYKSKNNFLKSQEILASWSRWVGSNSTAYRTQSASGLAEWYHSFQWHDPNLTNQTLVCAAWMTQWQHMTESPPVSSLPCDQALRSYSHDVLFNFSFGLESSPHPFPNRPQSAATTREAWLPT